MNQRSKRNYNIITPLDGYRELAADIIIMAVRDYKKRPGARCECGCRKINRTCIRSFLCSSWFETLCDMAGFCPENIKKHLEINL